MPVCPYLLLQFETQTYVPGINIWKYIEQVRIQGEQSRIGFSASKYDVGNWISSKSLEFIEKLSGTFWNFLKEFFGIFLGILCEFFQRNYFKEFFGRNFLEGHFWEKFLGGTFWEEFFGRNYLFTFLKLFEYESD